MTFAHDTANQRIRYENHFSGSKLVFKIFFKHLMSLEIDEIRKKSDGNTHTYTHIQERGRTGLTFNEP